MSSVRVVGGQVLGIAGFLGIWRSKADWLLTCRSSSTAYLTGVSIVECRYHKLLHATHRVFAHISVPVSALPGCSMALHSLQQQCFRPPRSQLELTSAHLEWCFRALHVQRQVALLSYSLTWYLISSNILWTLESCQSDLPRTLSANFFSFAQLL